MSQEQHQIARLSSPSTYQYVNVYATNDGYSVVEMNKSPVNSMNLEFLQEFIKVIDDVEKTPTSSGLIITSNVKAFCAGIDLMEFVNPKHERLHALWTCFQELLICLYSSPLVTIALINGAAVGGGCALALCCDYQVVVSRDFKIGVNAVELGIAVPHLVYRLYELVLGHRKAENLLLPGKLCTPQEALKEGIVDEMVSADDVMTVASGVMRRWLSVSEVGRKETKELMHRNFINECNDLKDKETKKFTENIINESLQNHILRYIDQLKNKKMSKL